MSVNYTFITPENLGRFKTKLYDLFADKSIVDALIGTDSGKTVRAIAAEELAAKLIPENADAALDTLAEIAAWIQEHPDDAATMNANISALQQAVASLQTSVNGLGDMAAKDTVAESDLADALKQKINAAADGNHSHGNKSVLDGITAAKVSSWDSKAAGDHGHTPAEIGAAPASHTHDYAASGHSHAYADLSGKPTIPTTVAQMTDAGNYALKTELPTFTEATDAQIDALFA